VADPASVRGSARARGIIATIVLVSVAAGCAARPAAPSTASSAAPSQVTPTFGPSPTVAQVASASAEADLAFPPRDAGPIEAPAEPTPESVIDAFHAFAHDPGHSYRAEGRGRWIVAGVEELSAASIAIAGGDRHLLLTDAAGGMSEAIVVGESASARTGDGAWEVIDASAVRGLYNLSTALVIGDLGPEPEGSGYRLVVEAGFDVFPQSASDADGVSRDVTEIVVDELGRPISLTSHRWWESNSVGDIELPEGVATFTFADVGEPVAIPPLPIEVDVAGTATPRPSLPPTAEVSGGGATVEMPGRPELTGGELSFWGPSGDGEALEIESRASGTFEEGRFELGSVSFPEDGLAPDERLHEVRRAITGRIPGGELLGHRPIRMDGLAGQEFVAAGNGLNQRAIMYRIRIVAVAGTLVILTVAGPISVVGSAAADRFLASFVVED
jgi:hypothetical protein